ncbi:MAG: hypothetical protein JNK87_24140 [Bryobacterales bacterium]|nr:hypothetical protein [Bryobacterales bacterium]
MKQVALWGPPSSGKTVWLAQLYIRLQRTNTNWQVFPASSATQAFIEEMRNLMTNQRRFPQGTTLENPVKIEYEFRHPAFPEHRRVFIEDRAGAVSLGETPDWLEAFSKVDGLVVLLDPNRQEYLSEVQTALENFYHKAREAGGQTDDRPVAFCLPKIDRLLRDANEVEFALQHPDAFVRDQLPADFIRFIEQYTGSRHKFFPVSAIGVQMDFGVIRPTVYYDERFELRLLPDGAPIHLLTPFEWLFQELG